MVKLERKLKRILLTIGVILFSCFLCELFFNLPVLILDEDEKGKTSIDDSSVEMDGFTIIGDSYILEGTSGSITWKLDGEYVDKFCYEEEFNSVNVVTAEIEVVSINGFGKEESKIISDNNPKLVADSVVSIKKRVSQITLRIVGDEELQEEYDNLVISNPHISNQVLINKYRICIIALIEIMISLIWFNREKVLKQIEIGFMIISLTIGLAMLLVLPNNKVGWDEEVHFATAYKISVWPGGETLPQEIAGQMAVTHYNWPYNQPQTYEEKEQYDYNMDIVYQEGDKNTTVQGDLGGLSFFGLCVQAVAIKIVRVFGCDFHTIFMAGRLAGLLMYIGIMTLAIRIIPIGKRILTFIALTPTSIFQAIVYTYDNSIFIFIVLGIALLLREWLSNDNRFHWRSAVLGCVSLIWGILPKAIYAPVVLIGMLIPKEKFKNQKNMIAFRILIGTIFALLMCSFIIPQLITPDYKTDIRGGDVDSVEQISLIIHHIPTYCAVFLKNVLSTMSDYVLGEPVYLAMGHLKPSNFSYLVPISVVLLTFIDHEDEKIRKIAIRQRLFVFFVLIMSIALIWTALYVAFTVPGSTFIAGVQARYYRPLLILIFLMFSNHILTANVSRKKINMAVLGVSALLIVGTVWELFLSFCL